MALGTFPKYLLLGLCTLTFASVSCKLPTGARTQDADVSTWDKRHKPTKIVLEEMYGEKVERIAQGASAVYLPATSMTFWKMLADAQESEQTNQRILFLKLRMQYKMFLAFKVNQQIAEMEASQDFLGKAPNPPQWSVRPLPSESRGSILGDHRRKPSLIAGFTGELNNHMHTLWNAIQTLHTLPIAYDQIDKPIEKVIKLSLDIFKSRSSGPLTHRSFGVMHELFNMKQNKKTHFVTKSQDIPLSSIFSFIQSSDWRNISAQLLYLTTISSEILDYMSLPSETFPAVHRTFAAIDREFAKTPNANKGVLPNNLQNSAVQFNQLITRIVLLLNTNCKSVEERSTCLSILDKESRYLDMFNSALKDARLVHEFRSFIIADLQSRFQDEHFLKNLPYAWNIPFQ